MPDFHQPDDDDRREAQRLADRLAEDAPAEPSPAEPDSPHVDDRPLPGDRPPASG